MYVQRHGPKFENIRQKAPNSEIASVPKGDKSISERDVVLQG